MSHLYIIMIIITLKQHLNILIKSKIKLMHCGYSNLSDSDAEFLSFVSI